MAQNDDGEGREVTTLEADATVVALLNKSEIDQQIATAHRYPRSIKAFRDDVEQLATLNEDVAGECSYALSRKDKDGNKKTIVGPSARFAEIVVHSWGNCRAGARVVDDRGEYVVAQGAFMDLQKNVAVTYEVQRRIVDSGGRRYSADMIGVTANAACSIAIRNAVLKGVPKALWVDLWERARKVAVGDVKTLSNKRLQLVEKFKQWGVDQTQILAKLKRASVEEITLDDLEVLIGIGSSIKNQETTPEAEFAPETEETGSAAVDKINAAAKATAAAAAKAGEKTGDGSDVLKITPENVAALIDKAKDADQIDLALDLIPKAYPPEFTVAWQVVRDSATQKRAAL